MPDWITDTIAIGTRLDALDADVMATWRFRSVLSLDGPLHLPVHANVRHVAYSLVDGPGNDARLFLRAVNAVARLVLEAAPLLVHCHAGRSRSPIVVAGHFIQTLALEPDAALEMVGRKREIVITTGLERLLWTI